MSSSACNPDFRSPTGHLLYARALEAEGNVPKALEEYRVLRRSFPGAEAAVRYAQLLQAQGQRSGGQQVARELLEQARIAPGHYRRAQRDWLEAAQRLLVTACAASAPSEASERKRQQAQARHGSRRHRRRLPPPLPEALLLLGGGTL